MAGYGHPNGSYHIQGMHMNLDQRGELNKAQSRSPKGNRQTAGPALGLNPEPSNVNKSPRSLHSKGPSISYKQLSVRTLLPEKMLEAAISPTQSYYGVPGCMHDSERLQGTFAGLPETSPKVASKSLTVGRHPAHLWKAPPSLTAIEITMPTSAPGAFRSPAAVPHVPNNWQQHTKTRLSKCTDSCSVTAPAQHGKDRTTAKNVISAMPTDAAAASVMRWLQQIQPGPDEHYSRKTRVLTLPDDIPAPLQARLDQLKKSELMAKYSN